MSKNYKKSRTKSNSDILSLLNSRSVIGAVIVFYALLIVFLLLAESTTINWFNRYRATDTVLLLIGLLFLPFFIMVSSKMIRSFTVKWAGKEVQVDLGEFSERVESEFERVEKKVTGQVSTAEQALWPMLAGYNPLVHERWQDKKIIIGSKLDLSQVFMANFLAEWLQRHIPDVQCETRVPNGGSLKNFADVKYNWVDLYIDFTGTCCQYFNVNHRNKNDQDIVNELNGYASHLGIEFMQPIGATENYCLVVPNSLAEDRKLNTISDLSAISKGLVFSADPEYLNRRDCYLGLKAEYNFNFKQIQPCRITDRYALLEDNQADVFVGYETDPEISIYDMKVLVDDKQFFPRYAAVPLVSAGALEHIDGLREALAALADQISTEDLIEEVRKLSIRGTDTAIAKALAQKYCEKILL